MKDVFTKAAIGAHPDLARKLREAYRPAETARMTMIQSGRYPEGCRSALNILNYSDTEDARNLYRHWREYFELEKQWEALHPAPEGFWWGAGDGWPQLIGPQEEWPLAIEAA